MADTTERWVEVWKGEDPSIPGQKLETEGIEMRIASAGWGAHGGGIGFLSLFRRRGQARLLVRDTDKERARQALNRPLPPPRPPAETAPPSE